ncbi:hypothetical protein COE53_16410 [Bacillus sp. AFS029533]|nr:hypothetical protein COE53_16410 [Bacillus sp. AFS029533]
MKKFFTLAILSIGIVLSILSWFYNHNEVISLISRISIGVGILINTISIFKQKLSKAYLYLIIICFSFFLLLDAFRFVKLFM